MCSGRLHTPETGVCVLFESQCHQSFPLFPEPDQKSFFFLLNFTSLSLQYVSWTGLPQSRFSTLAGDTGANVRHPACLLKICHNEND